MTKEDVSWQTPSTANDTTLVPEFKKKKKNLKKKKKSKSMCQVLLHTAAGRERVQLGPRAEAVELLWPRIRELAPPL